MAGRPGDQVADGGVDVGSIRVALEELLAGGTENPGPDLEVRIGLVVAQQDQGSQDERPGEMLGLVEVEQGFVLYAIAADVIRQGVTPDLPIGMNHGGQLRLDARRDRLPLAGVPLQIL